ncbi:MAG: HAD hydrolase family protein [Elusimicrobiales bacterium]|nr:HAD hydrolase family protein [Elusimicrobiales bacterium]
MRRLKDIKIFLMDVDGVLTDGKMYYFVDNRGIAHEFKAFDSHDGIGLTTLSKFGIITGIITGRESESVYERAKLLKISFVYEGFFSKMVVLDEILSKTSLDYDDVCYIGDDLPDIPILKKVGFAVCPNNAVKEVKKVCDYVTKKTGGNGAVREVCELILKEKNLTSLVKKGYEYGKWPDTPDNIKTEDILYSKWKLKNK